MSWLFSIRSRYFSSLSRSSSSAFLRSAISLLSFSTEVVVFFKFLSYVYNWFLLSSDEQIGVLAISGFASILNIILNYFLIIKYSAMGAAAATIITELFLLAFYYLFFRIKWHRIYCPNVD